jgi:hypothetical protein
LSLVLEKTKTTGDFPLISRKLDPDSYFTVSYPSVPSGASPWQYPPIQLTCSAKRVDEWKLENEWTPDVPQSPVTTNNPEEKITLVPFGSAPIRITYFPITASRYSHALGND